MGNLARKLMWMAGRERAVGQIVLTGPAGEYEWVVPDGVYSVSVLIVDAGIPGARGSNGSNVAGGGGAGGAAGGRGRVAYRNDIPVTPGQVISGYIGGNSLTSYTTFGGVFASNTGGTAITRPALSDAVSGGPGGESSGGAGGSGGCGIDLVYPTQNRAPSRVPYRKGESLPEFPAGLPGAPGAWPGGSGGGGGGGGRWNNSPGGAGGAGANAAIRIIWPGDERQFPDVRTEDENVPYVVTPYWGAAADSHTITFPTPDPGDLLVMALSLGSNAGNPGYAIPGWTKQREMVYSDPNTPSAYIFTRIADGSETSVTVPRRGGSAEQATAQIFQIGGSAIAPGATLRSTPLQGIAYSFSASGRVDITPGAAITASEKVMQIPILFLRSGTSVSPFPNAFPFSHSRVTAGSALSAHSILSCREIFQAKQGLTSGTVSYWSAGNAAAVTTALSITIL